MCLGVHRDDSKLADGALRIQGIGGASGGGMNAVGPQLVGWCGGSPGFFFFHQLLRRYFPGSHVSTPNYILVLTFSFLRRRT